MPCSQAAAGPLACVVLPVTWLPFPFGGSPPWLCMSCCLRSSAELLASGCAHPWGERWQDADAGWVHVQCAFECFTQCSMAHVMTQLPHGHVQYLLLAQRALHVEGRAAAVSPADMAHQASLMPSQMRR